MRVERPDGPWPPWVELPAGAAGAGRGLTTTSMSFAAASVGSGVGIGVLPVLVAASLPVPVERVLPETTLASPTFSLLWPASRQLSPRVRAFVDFMVEAFGG